MPEADSNIVESIAHHLRQPIRAAIDGRNFIILPDGMKVEDAQRFQAFPARASGTLNLHDAPSFIIAVNALKGTATTRIYCDADQTKATATFMAVFNDNAPGMPGWCDHRAVFATRPSVEWSRWKGKDRQPMTQAAFAEWLEENMRDVATIEGLPTGSAMLEMALTMEVTQDARFKSALRLQSGGVDLTYVSKDDDTTLQRMRVFDRFALGVAPFLNGAHYQVMARLRYRVKEGAVNFWYELVRPDLVFADALKEIVAKVSAETGAQVLYGAVA